MDETSSLFVNPTYDSQDRLANERLVDENFNNVYIDETSSLFVNLSIAQAHVWIIMLSFRSSINAVLNALSQFTQLQKCTPRQ